MGMVNITTVGFITGGKGTSTGSAMWQDPHWEIHVGFSRCLFACCERMLDRRARCRESSHQQRDIGGKHGQRSFDQAQMDILGSRYCQGDDSANETWSSNSGGGDGASTSIQ